MISYFDIQRGYDAWAAKPHNAKWVRKIDGTPIANDIVVCIWEVIREDVINARVALEAVPPSPVGESRDERPSDRDFLHRLIENAFSWALQDCNYLNPKYMDRLIDCTHNGMKPEQAAVWNATAPEQATRAVLAAKEQE